MVDLCALVFGLVGDAGTVTREDNTIFVRNRLVKASRGILRLSPREKQWFGRLDAVSEPLDTTLDLAEILTELLGDQASWTPPR